MSKTAQLLALAEAALSVEPIDVDDGDVTFNGGSTSWNKTQRNFFRVLTPETIKQLVELVRLQHEALGVCRTMADHNNDGVSYDACDKAIEAFNKLEGE